MSDFAQGNAGDYSAVVDDLEAMGIAFCGLAREVLRANDINVHSIDYRVKEHASATKKLIRDPERYSGFEDLHDLLGLRIITYFEDEVDRVAKLLTPEFKIDRANSHDKRKDLDPDQFGYMSLHFIASLTAKRAKLVEYQRFADRTFEVQVRSILQHAWAEIEHDLGYKSEEGLPSDFRRRFSRLAGMLEVADDEFTRLRKDLDGYQRRVERTVKTSPSGLKLDQSTVVEVVKQDRVLKLDGAIASLFPAELTKTIDPKFAGRVAHHLRILNVTNVQMLIKLLDVRSGHILAFATKWLEEREPKERDKPIQRGITLFYLQYTLAAEASDATFAEWWEVKNWDTPVTSSRIKKVWAKVLDEVGPPAEL